MRRRCQIQPRARGDIDDQAFHFSSRRSGLGTRFQAALRRTFARLAKSPDLHARYGFEQVHLRDIGVCQVDEFPQMLVDFRSAGSGVVILRILHAARDVESLADEFDDD